MARPPISPRSCGCPWSLAGPGDGRRRRLAIGAMRAAARNGRIRLRRCASRVPTWTRPSMKWSGVTPSAARDRNLLDPLSRPAGLEARLAARGYRSHRDRRRRRCARLPGAALPVLASGVDNVELSERVTEDRPAASISAPSRRTRRDQRPHPRWHPRAVDLRTGARDGRPVSSALAVADGANAIVECMATVAEGVARRWRASRGPVGAGATGRARKGPSISRCRSSRPNTPAVGLYAGAGWRPLCESHFRGGNLPDRRSRSALHAAPAAHSPDAVTCAELASL